LEKEKVKLDEVLKFLFSTSNKVLIKLLNGIFDEKFKEKKMYSLMPLQLFNLRKEL
jgi:hypothetical protein